MKYQRCKYYNVRKQTQIISQFLYHMSRAQIQAYQQRLAHLQTDNIIYQEQIQRLRRRLIQLQEYRIKYQLLLQRQTEQSPLHRSRRADEINHMNRKIEQGNDKWIQKMKVLEGKYERTIQQLQDQNIKLLKQIDEHNKPVKPLPMNEQPSAQLTTLRKQLKDLQSTNSQLSKTLQSLKLTSQTQSHKYHLQLQSKLQQAKENQKQFYRSTIQLLQLQLQQVKQQLDLANTKASPQRQKYINVLQLRLQERQRQNDRQVLKLNNMVKVKIVEISELTRTFGYLKQQNLKIIHELERQLLQARQKLFHLQKQHHDQMMACRHSMTQQRQTQVDSLKDSLINIQDSFQAQRQQWKAILEEQQQQLTRIRKTWQQQKQKYLQEKNRLKAKIQQLKQGMKRSSQCQKQVAQNQTAKMIGSLRQIDQFQDKYNDYQSGITFLHRQLKRATSKIQQKQRQTSNLMRQLAQQRDQFISETEYIKGVQRKQAQFYREKLSQIDCINSKLLEQLREKQIYTRNKQSQYAAKHKKVDDENESLRNIIEEMERDYRRLTDNRKNIYHSYKNERDHVFTGKAELNQERKRKLRDINRQKDQLQIAYKERERQIRNEHQLKIAQMQEKLSKTNKQVQQRDAQVLILKQKASRGQTSTSNKHQKQEIYKEYHKKLASLDLQIQLGQNIYSTLRDLRSRANKADKSKTDLEELSENQSSPMLQGQRDNNFIQEMSLDQDDVINNYAAPTFAARNNRFNFQIDNHRVNTGNFPQAGLQMSFHPDPNDYEQEQP